MVPGVPRDLAWKQVDEAENCVRRRSRGDIYRDCLVWQVRRFALRWPLLTPSCGARRNADAAATLASIQYYHFLVND